MEPVRISHFELVRLLGRGGMGEVHEALDLKLRRRVALKFLSPELTVDDASLARFEREAHAAAELTHPHIATVYAFEPEGNTPFIAMELLTGPGLRQRIDAGSLPLAEALGIARDVAAALAFAHRRGIAHRDIKPENLMFDEHGKIKVMDFGLARATMSSKLTMTGTSLGTPAYMSPEAIRGESAAASDVFALGLVLYEMLAGRRAYPGENVMSVMFSIANDAPQPLQQLRADVPEEVLQCIERMLVKDPGARADAASIANELAALTGAPPPVTSGNAFGPVRDGSDLLVTQARTLPLGPALGSGEATMVMTRGAAVAASAGGGAAPASAGESIAASGAAATRRGPPRAALLAGVVLVLAAAVVAVVLSGAGASRRKEARLRNIAEAQRLQELGTEVGQANNLDSARVLYQQSLVLNPGQPGALNNLGLMALEAQRYTLAESLFKAMLEHNPSDSTVRATALHNLAECDIARKAYGRAVTRLEEALALDNKTPEAYNNLVWAYMQNHQPADALVVAKRGLDKFPGEPFLYKNAGVAARALGDLPGALGYLNTAVRLDTTFKEAADLRAQVAKELAAAK